MTVYSEASFLPVHSTYTHVYVHTTQSVTPVFCVCVYTNIHSTLTVEWFVVPGNTNTHRLTSWPPGLILSLDSPHPRWPFIPDLSSCATWSVN